MVGLGLWNAFRGLLSWVELGGIGFVVIDLPEKSRIGGAEGVGVDEDIALKIRINTREEISLN